MQNGKRALAIALITHAAACGAAMAQDGEVADPAAVEDAAAEQPGGFFSSWEGRFLIGVFGTAGNSESNTVEFIADGERDTEDNRSYYELLYNFSRSDGDIGNNNGRLTLGNDFKFKDSDWFAYINGVTEYDELKSWDGRFRVDAGIGYEWIDEETERFVSTIGGGAELEVGSMDTAWNPLITQNNEYFKQIDENQEFSAFLGFIFDLSETENVRVRAGAEYSWLIDPDRNMSLVGRIETEYDAEPSIDDAGNPDNEFDTSYSVLLSWEY